MTVARKDFATIQQDFTVQLALDTIRERGLGERIAYFYVVNDRQELVGVLPRLLDHFRRRLVDALADLGGVELIERIAGHHARAAPCGLGVEAGRAIATAKHAALQVGAGQREHPHVLVVRTPPRHDGRQGEHET